ncbi:maltase A1-like [Pararge aegeria]|uniref:alpha-glucosidase n=1 Tax=Pararge aegeria aegeria TaxID=348720 RepID=A0A8S4R317_9NEOP|nr:maltase A1-like [Pararge aegeria]CAH2229153.1 jg20766 [Pararge aegeria aegeria]
MRLPILLLLVATAASASDLDWWKTALIYQIYPRSFKDSNGDGTGDLNGITEKLPYLHDTGIDAIWLSPIYRSPNYDSGYDITDYRSIQEEYGTMEDFERLLNVSRSLGIRVVLDFVPNHTGNESEWFNRSIAGEAPYNEYYVWADGLNATYDNGTVYTKPPSNWISNFRKSAWEFNEVRGQYYLHQFVIGQPDLNYRSNYVQEAMKNVLRFWLDKGVSGFRVDAVNKLYEADPNNYGGVYPDEPLSGAANAGPDDYEYLSHIYTENLLETYDVVYSWRDVLDEYITSQGEYKIMMTEAYAALQLMIRYYGTSTRNGSIPFNFSFLGDINKNSTAWEIKTVIDRWMTYMPSGRVANWVIGNHDQSRVANRQGVDRIDAMNMLALILPGVTITYQGEEIGMEDGYVSWNDTQDPQACNTDDPINYYLHSRDPNRTPYQWDSTAHAGFSNTTGSTWLPVADNYLTLNLAAQIANPKSHYHFYKDVVTNRKSPAIQEGDLDTRALSESILVVTRLLPGEAGMLGVVNLASEAQTIDLTSLRLLPSDLEVVASGVNCALEKNATLTKSSIPVSGHCALLFRSGVVSYGGAASTHYLSYPLILLALASYTIIRTNFS